MGIKHVAHDKVKGDAITSALWNAEHEAILVADIDSNEFNAANKLVKLDADAKTPLAQIPVILTGKDADTIDGIEGAEIFKKDGSVAMTDNLDMNGRNIDSVSQYYLKNNGVNMLKFLGNMFAQVSFYPQTTGSLLLGDVGLKWSDLYAVVVHQGDVAFGEKECVVCGKKFKLSDNLILKVIQFDEETEEPMAIPIHAECANTHKTFTKKYAIKEDYNVWDEDTGEVVTRKRNKTIKKKIVKHKIKQGYELDITTKKFCKIKKQADKMTREKIVSKVEATEDVEEEISEIVYEEKEFVI